MEQVTKISSATIIFSYKFHSSPCKIRPVAGAAIRNFGSSSGVGRPYTANHLLICYFSYFRNWTLASKQKEARVTRREEGGSGRTSLQSLHPRNIQPETAAPIQQAVTPVQPQGPTSQGPTPLRLQDATDSSTIRNVLTFEACPFRSFFLSEIFFGGTEVFFNSYDIYLVLRIRDQGSDAFLTPGSGIQYW